MSVPSDDVDRIPIFVCEAKPLLLLQGMEHVCLFPKKETVVDVDSQFLFIDL